MELVTDMKNRKVHTDEVRSALYNAKLLAGNEAAREAEVDDLHVAVRPVL